MNFSPFRKGLGVFLGFLILCSTGARAEVAVSDPASDASPTNQVLATYKKMSLEELMNQEVTSASKEAEPYAQAPAAIQVVTGDEIHRSGATGIVPSYLNWIAGWAGIRPKILSWPSSARILCMTIIPNTVFPGPAARKSPAVFTER